MRGLEKDEHYRLIAQKRTEGFRFILQTAPELWLRCIGRWFITAPKYGLLVSGQSSEQAPGSLESLEPPDCARQSRPFSHKHSPGLACNIHISGDSRTLLACDDGESFRFLSDWDEQIRPQFMLPSDVARPTGWMISSTAPFFRTFSLPTDGQLRVMYRVHGSAQDKGGWPLLIGRGWQLRGQIHED